MEFQYQNKCRLLALIMRHAELTFPALTTINLNIFDLGYEAANA